MVLGFLMTINVNKIKTSQKDDDIWTFEVIKFLLFA